MPRWVPLALFVVLAACGGADGSNSQGPPSARSVAEGSFDFSRVQRCPGSGPYSTYLRAEQATNPSQYAFDKRTWDGLRSAGMTDTYVVLYAAPRSTCGGLGAGPAVRAAHVYAIRFRDSASAGAYFKTPAGQFYLSDADVANVKAEGGTVDQGAATSLGTNSIVLATSTVGGQSYYIALWQNKLFEIALIAYNIPITEGNAAATKINERIH